MGRLGIAYLSGGGSAASPTQHTDADALELLLEELWVRGRAAYPDFDVPDEVFVAHLARCGAVISATGDSVHAEDLFLACACLQRDEAAIRLLVAMNKPMLTSALSRVDSSPAFVDDVQQRFWDSVLVGTISAPPRLTIYSGHGALAGWVGVGAQRVALMMRRHEQAEGRARDAAEHGDGAFLDPELAFIRDRYLDQFRAATQKALDTLDDRERMIFRLHVVDGVTIRTDRARLRCEPFDGLSLVWQRARQGRR